MNCVDCNFGVFEVEVSKFLGVRFGSSENWCEPWMYSTTQLKPRKSLCVLCSYFSVFDYYSRVVFQCLLVWPISDSLNTMER